VMRAYSTRAGWWCSICMQIAIDGDINWWLRFRFRFFLPARVRKKLHNALDYKPSFSRCKTMTSMCCHGPSQLICIPSEVIQMKKNAEVKMNKWTTTRSVETCPDKLTNRCIQAAGQHTSSYSCQLRGLQHHIHTTIRKFRRLITISFYNLQLKLVIAGLPLICQHSPAVGNGEGEVAGSACVRGR
jgi:hypothetical protein